MLEKLYDTKGVIKNRVNQRTDNTMVKRTNKVKKKKNTQKTKDCAI